MPMFFWVFIDTIMVFSKNFQNVGEGPNPLIGSVTLPNQVDTFEKQFQDELAKQRAEAR